METAIRWRDRIFFKDACIRKTPEGAGQILLSQAAIKELSERVFHGGRYDGLRLLATCIYCLASQANIGPCPGISPEFFNPVIKLPNPNEGRLIGNCGALETLSTLPVGSTVPLI